MNDVNVMQVRNSLIDAGRRLDARHLIAGSEGNVSARVDDDRILITTSGTMLGSLGLGSFVIVEVATGERAEGSATPTSELMAHLEAYRADPTIGAVVHAHPTSAVAMTLRGWSLEAVPLPEAAYALGSVPTCEFTVPGTDEGGRVTRRWAATRHAVLFDRHGAITFGRSLAEALGRMEMLDALATIVLRAGGPDGMKPLTEEQIERVVTAARSVEQKHDALDAWAEKVATLEKQR